MDEGFVELKGSQGISLALPLKCAGSISPDPIKTIAIDSNRPMEEIQSPPKHEHFSILGFVAGMRKKDKKVCWPFASKGGDDMSLPPISVPKFRRWQCLDCVADILDQKSIQSNESNAGTSSIQNLVAEKQKFSLSVKNIGDEHGSRDVRICKVRSSFPHSNIAAKNPTAIPHQIVNVSSSSDEDVQHKLRSLADIMRDDENFNHPAYLKGCSVAAKTLQRKRTMVLEDEEEMVLQKPVAKILKGFIVESENNTCNDNDTIPIIEISDSDSEEDNSRPIIFGSRGKGHQNKAWKQSSIDINRKTSQTNFDGQQMDTIHYKLKGKRVEEGCHYSPYTNMEKQEPPGRHTGIPDLNEPFFEKMPMTEGLQIQTFPEMAIHKNLTSAYIQGTFNFPYTNDAIPAMKLLSLMDQGIVMDSSFKVEQFSPSNQHPRPLKSQSNHINGFPALLNVARRSGGSSSNKSFSQDQVPPQKGNTNVADLAGPSNLELEVCTLNRNPADFSIPDTRNEFTICAKDLKPKKRNPPYIKSRTGNVEGSKKQRVRKRDLSRK